jgi:hypothetical protein
MANEGLIVGSGTAVHEITQGHDTAYTVCGADFVQRGKFNRGRRVAQAPTCKRCSHITGNLIARPTI